MVAVLQIDIPCLAVVNDENFNEARHTPILLLRGNFGGHFDLGRDPHRHHGSLYFGFSRWHLDVLYCIIAVI